jgi:hypothetical protein
MVVYHICLTEPTHRVIARLIESAGTNRSGYALARITRHGMFQFNPL